MNPPAMKPPGSNCVQLALRMRSKCIPVLTCLLFFIRVIHSADINKLANDIDFIVQFATGDPFPDLVPQDESSGIRFAGIYHSQPKRYVLKKAFMSRVDNRIFDVDSGKLVYVSHHVGKNPYEILDPLDLTNLDTVFGIAGEWESICTVSGEGPFVSFKVRPKKLSRHGRQFVKPKGVGDDDGDDKDDNDGVLMNVAKMSKLKSLSMRPHFTVSRGKDSDDVVYKCKADLVGRKITINNERDELVAQITKTNKAMIQSAIFGSGSESTIDIAPGVDCSTILAIVYAIGQVGIHYIGDAFENFVKNPIKSSMVHGAIGAAAGGGNVAEMAAGAAVVNTMDTATENLQDVVGDVGDGAADVIGDALDGAGEVASSIGDNLEPIIEFVASLFLL